jgi:hypothetical protein
MPFSVAKSLVATGPGSSASRYVKVSDFESRVIEAMETSAAAVPAAMTSVKEASSW